MVGSVSMTGSDGKILGFLNVSTIVFSFALKHIPVVNLIGIGYAWLN